MSNDAKGFFMIVAFIAMFLAWGSGFIAIINYFYLVEGALACVVYFVIIMLTFATIAGEGSAIRGFKWITGNNIRD